MGYESRLLIASRHDFGENCDVCTKRYSNEILAVIELCKMGEPTFKNENSELFTQKLNPKTDEVYGCFDFKDDDFCDPYGSVCGFAPIENVINELKRIYDKYLFDCVPPYRRIMPAIRALEAYVNECAFGNLIVIHYGH